MEHLDILDGTLDFFGDRCINLYDGTEVSLLPAFLPGMGSAGDCKFCHRMHWRRCGGFFSCP